MLKIHCCPLGSQRNELSGVVESTASSTLATTVPLMICVRLKLVTTTGVPTELQLASKTQNLAGTVLPCLNTLVLSALTGCRIVWPGVREPFTRHEPDA